MTRKIAVLSVDNQRDFMLPDWGLYVPEAELTIDPIVTFFDRMGSRIDEVMATLDQHVPDCHISLSSWYVDSKGNHPAPFTLLRNRDNKIESYDPVTGDATGIWKCSYGPVMEEWTLHYLKSLEEDGRYPHCLWTPHCEIGSDGACLVPEIFKAFRKWSSENKAMIMFQPKGSNIKVEHFSGVKAQIEDPDDPVNTGLNTVLIENAVEYDDICIIGQAWNFCVANTVLDMKRVSPELAQKFILFTDCTTEIKGPGGCFEPLTTAFMDEMTGDGMRVMKSTEYLAG